MSALPATMADAAGWTPPDEVRVQPLFKAGYAVGARDTLQLIGTDTDGGTVAGTGDVPGHAGLDAAIARHRQALADVRGYAHKPQPQTAPQLMAAARHSWRLVEREIRQGNQPVAT